MSQWSLLVDLLIVVFLSFCLWRGYKVGLLAASANLLGLIVSLLAAYAFYAPVASWLSNIWPIPPSLLNIFAFLLLAFVIDTLITGSILLLSKKMGPRLRSVTHPSWFAAGLGLANGLITVAYMTSIFSSLPIEHPMKVAVTQAVLARPLIDGLEQLGSPVQKLVTPAINELSQLFTIEPDSKEIVTLNFSSDSAFISLPDEQQMLKLLNQERAKQGLNELVLATDLRQVGRAHSLDMFKRGYFSHYSPEGLDPFDRIEAANIQYLAAGENLALAPTVDMAHTGLMNSPGHKRNILDPKYNKVGIGAYKDPRYGIIFTQVFSN